MAATSSDPTLFGLGSILSWVFDFDVHVTNTSYTTVHIYPKRHVIWDDNILRKIYIYIYITPFRTSDNSVTFWILLMSIFDYTYAPGNHVYKWSSLRKKTQWGMPHNHTIHSNLLKSSPVDKLATIMAGDNLKCIFLNNRTSIRISLKCVLRDAIGNKPALVQVMAWRRTGDKPLPQLMLTQFTDVYMRHQSEVYSTIRLWYFFCLIYNYQYTRRDNFW